MVYYDYTISFASFAGDLKDKLVANGWTLAEAGYNACKPVGYEIYIETLMGFFATLPITDGSATTAAQTYLRVRMRSAYDAVNHRPLITAAGGVTIYRLVRNATDYSTSGTGLLFVKAWIWNKGFILKITPDPNTVLTTRGDQIVICSEGLAVDASANTMLLLAPTYDEYGLVAPAESEAGGKSFAQSYSPNESETHFIHCLADGHGYVPITLGFGVSFMSNKVRTMPLYAWRFRGDGTNQPEVLCYQIPQMRATLIRSASPVIEQVGDTFTIDAQTYKLHLQGVNNFLDSTGGFGRPMISKAHYMYVLSYGPSQYFTYDAWVRSA